MAKVYLNGELVEKEHARISVFDHGLVVGDGVYETILLHRRRPFALLRHLARLQRSASGLGIEGLSPEDLANAVAGVVETCEFETGRIRVIVTSGEGPLGSARGQGPPTLVVAAEPLELPQGPAAVVVVPWTRNEHGALAGLKTTSYAENARALAYAHDNDADEAVFANTEGMLCEATGSNVFAVFEGELITPPLSAGCLDGVTRTLVLEQHGGREHDLAISSFFPGIIEEAFLTSTLRGVQPIGAIDGTELSVVGGPETEKAAAAYEELLAREGEL